MRNTERSGNTVFTNAFSSWALFRSCPKGFSITTRRHGLGWPAGESTGCARPFLDSCSSTIGKSLGGIDR